MEIVAKQNSVSNANAYDQNQPAVSAKNNLDDVAKFNDIVIFSQQTLMQSQVDDLYQQLDSVYLSRLSKADKKSLETAYAQLDQIFQTTQPSELQDQQAEKLFAQIDQVFTTAEAALTAADKHQIETLNDKLDGLFADFKVESSEVDSLEVDSLEVDSLEDVPVELLIELDPLELELDKILSSNLSSEQKKELNTLHGQIGRLFDQNERAEQGNKAIEAAFDKIDGILNRSFEALPDADKQRVKLLESNIEDVFDAMAQHREEISGYYPV